MFEDNTFAFAGWYTITSISQQLEASILLFQEIKRECPDIWQQADTFRVNPAQNYITTKFFSVQCVDSLLIILIIST